MAKRASIPLKRIATSHGWMLFSVQKDDHRFGRVVQFTKDRISVSEGEAILNLDHEDVIEVDFTTGDLTLDKSLGQIFLVPIGQVAAIIAPEPKPSSALVLPSKEVVT